MTSKFCEDFLEEVEFSWLCSSKYNLYLKPDIAPGKPFAERNLYNEAIIERRFKGNLMRLNLDISQEALVNDSISNLYADFISSEIQMVMGCT